MKRFVAIILAAAMIVSCFAMTSFAASDTKKAKLSLTIDTSGITVNSDPESLGDSDIKVTAVEQAAKTQKANYFKNEDQSSPYYGLEVTIYSTRVISPSHDLKVGESAKVEMEIIIGGYYTDDAGKQYEWVPGDSKSISLRKDNESDGPGINTKTVRKQGDIYILTFTTKALKGEYDTPENLEWANSMSLGNARWTKPESGNCANLFDFRLRRDGKLVVEFSNISGTSLNVYPWMEREGDYTFEVRSAVGSGTSGAKRSEWTESDSQYIDAQHVSDGTGKYDPSGTGGNVDPGTGTSGNTNQIGWIKSGNVWYYRYPDGTYRKNGWEKVSDKWYYFDGSGAMKTGWVTINNQTYYLDSTNGDMKTGWVKTADGQWYYLNPDPNSSTQGAMLKNQWADINGRTYYFGASGAMTTGWLKIGEKFYYFNPAQNAELGALVRNQRIDSFYVGADGAWERGK